MSAAPALAGPVLARAPASARVSLQRKCACASGGTTCARCEDRHSREASLQRKGGPEPARGAIPGIVHDVLGSAGRPLAAGLRAAMEARLGGDFSRVQIHDDAQARESAAAVSALAYTVGHHVVLARPMGADPGLLAHELTHVRQQAGGGVGSGIDADPALEREADRAAEAIVERRPVPRIAGRGRVALARAATGDGEMRYEITLPEGKRIMTASEYAAEKARITRRLRSQLGLVASLADNGRSSQEDMLREYQGGVESLSDLLHKPKALIGIVSDMRAGVTPPYLGMWSSPKSTAARGQEALDRGDIAEAARLLRLADQHYRNAMHEWNAYREATIGGAESVASDLEVVRDVSFAIALAAGAAVAAPLVAGAVGVGGLGLTGVAATGATAVGTAGVTGALGATLGGGSTALGTYSATGHVDYAATKRDAVKFGKQGVVTGLTGGLGRAIGAGGKAADLARPFAQQALRRCLTDAGISVTGEITTEVLDKVTGEPRTTGPGASGAHPVLPPAARSAVSGCVGGVLGLGAAKLPAPVRGATDKLAGAGVAYADARLAGQSSDEALRSAAESTLTSVAVGHAQAHTERRQASAAATKVAAAPVATPSGKTMPSPPAAAPAAPQAAPPGAAPVVKPAASQHAPDALRAKLRQVVAEAKTHPAILKEEAVARAPIGDGHEATVTPHGVGGCSPSPCPVIHVQYAKELEQFPGLKARNEEIQALRKTDPARAATEGAALIRTLEAARHNNARAALHGPGEDEMVFTLDVSERRAADIRAGRKDFRLSHPVTYDVDERRSVGGPISGLTPPQERQERLRRASDPMNHQILDSMTNRVSKHVGSEQGVPLPPGGRVSLRDQPDAMMSNYRIGQIKELDVLFRRAVQKVGNPGSLRPTEYKARINAHFRALMEGAGPGEPRSVRRASRITQDAMRSIGFERVAGVGMAQVSRVADSGEGEGP